MRRYTRKQILTISGRWTLVAVLASITGFLSWKSYKAGKFCKTYDKCGSCRDTSDCSLKANTGKPRWKAK